MKTAYLIQDAQAWAAWLVMAEKARGSGDLGNAMKRISRRYGIPYRLLWALRYRPPKRLFADVYLGLQAAYHAELARQQEALRHELELTKRVAGPDHPAVRAAEALVGSRHSEDRR